jgi:hypothetical protein
MILLFIKKYQLLSNGDLSYIQRIIEKQYIDIDIHDELGFKWA